jgi:hypothetical protein
LGGTDRDLRCEIAPSFAGNFLPYLGETDSMPDMRTILIVILILLLVGAFPAWPYSSGWGYYPFGGIGLALLILIILALTGRL